MTAPVEIRPLVDLPAAVLGSLIVGYESAMRYAVSQTETPAQTVIALTLEPLARPYRKRWDPPDAALAEHYAGLPKLGFSLGAWAGEQWVGLALAEPRAWNKSLWVWEFHVAAEFQGRGVGRRLMAVLAERARAAGLRTMVCETQNTNVPAIQFYRAVGFALEGIDLSYYTNADLEPQGEVALFMKRRLE